MRAQQIWNIVPIPRPNAKRIEPGARFELRGTCYSNPDTGFFVEFEDAADPRMFSLTPPSQREAE